MSQQFQAKFGLSLSTRAVLFDWATMDQIVDAAKTAEDSGCFDSVWVGDNLLSKPRVEAIVTLSAIAARTKKVKLGTICLASFPLRDPVLFAIQWASLDVLSGGRTLLSVCNGGSALDGPQFANELKTFGVRSPERPGRLVEGVKILRRLWSEERVTHQGKYYQFSDVEALPKPVQQPPPILIAANPKPGQADDGTVDRILRRVATHGDGWQTDATPVDTFNDRFNRIKTYAAERGRDPSQLDSCLHLMVNINEDREPGLPGIDRLPHHLLRGRLRIARESRPVAGLRPSRSRHRKNPGLHRRWLHHPRPPLRRPQPLPTTATLHRRSPPRLQKGLRSSGNAAKNHLNTDTFFFSQTHHQLF